MPERINYLRVVLNATDQSFYAIGTDCRMTLCNRAFLDKLGFEDESEVVGRKLHDIIHHSCPDGTPYSTEDCPIYLCASTGVAAHVEDEIFFCKDGTPVPVTYDGHPIVIDGRLEGAICTFVDVTERRREHRLLQEAENRYRLLFTSLEAGFCIIDVLFDDRGQAQDYRFVEVNPAFARQTGLEDSVGKTVRQLAPDHEQSWMDLYGRVALTGVPVEVEHEAKALNRWFQVHAFKTNDAIPHRVAVLFSDITDRKQAELRATMLAEELQHRVKNTLAMVQAIVRQTLRGSGADPEALAAIEARLAALGKSHDMLTRGGWSGSDIRTLVSVAVLPHSDPASNRFVVDGPEVVLSAQVSMSLSLLLHELATNAVKYGALSVPQGVVEVEWKLVARDGSEPPETGFELTWTERDGPRVTQPRQRGFGSKLIEKVLASAFGGTATLEFREAGLVCRVTGRLDAPG